MKAAEWLSDTDSSHQPSNRPALTQPLSLSLVLELIGMTIVPLSLLWVWQSELMVFWDGVIRIWAEWLDLSLSIGSNTTDTLPDLSRQNDGSSAPSQATLSLTALAVLAIYLLSERMQDRYYPLATLLRGICVIQTTALVFFEVAPASFPYTISSHVQSQLEIGYLFMLAIPLMLAMGWGVMNVGRFRKLWVPFVFLAYFIVTIPHLGLLHALILDRLSLLFMPVLYFCFGLLLHLMVFIAFYSLLLSLTPIPVQDLRERT